ncbi:MAG: hypothetical protein F4056_06125 [Chloroflexi bacterium]|nr:hypothetical protein [Chloroflexota bacterium]MYI82879.1 hypothetical protein [Chloroflexota bacterium]
MSSRRNVQVLEAETAEPTLAGDSFWHPPTPEELIRQSGVAPYTFPDPSDIEDPEDVEAFLDAIFGDRSLQ